MARPTRGSRVYPPLIPTEAKPREWILNLTDPQEHPVNSDCYVYIMTNWNNKVLYVGMTHDIVRRVYEHKQGIYEGFTKKYHCKKLIYFTRFRMTVDAIA